MPPAGEAPRGRTGTARGTPARLRPAAAGTRRWKPSTALFGFLFFSDSSREFTPGSTDLAEGQPPCHTHTPPPRSTAGCPSRGGAAPRRAAPLARRRGRVTPARCAALGFSSPPARRTAAPCPRSPPVPTSRGLWRTAPRPTSRMSCPTGRRSRGPRTTCSSASSPASVPPIPSTLSPSSSPSW